MASGVLRLEVLHLISVESHFVNFRLNTEIGRLLLKIFIKNSLRHDTAVIIVLFVIFTGKKSELPGVYGLGAAVTFFSYSHVRPYVRFSI